jgi:hypothetical protein
VVQLLPLADVASRRKGRDPPATQPVHADMSFGATHEEQPCAHGRHHMVALGANPAGHSLRHCPSWKTRLAALHALALTAEDLLMGAMQAAASGPSHAWQEAWQASHVPSDVAHVPSGHASKHFPPIRIGLIQSCLHEAQTPGLAGSQVWQSKLSHSAHCVPVGVATAYLPAGQARLHRFPIRFAPEAQSASVKGVSGVGSTHCVFQGPVQLRHPAWHRLHLPAASTYSPSGHELAQRVPSRIGFTLGGHVDFMHGFFVQLAQSEARGPEQVLHEPWQRLHVR